MRWREDEWIGRKGREGWRQTQSGQGKGNVKPSSVQDHLNAAQDSASSPPKLANQWLQSDFPQPIVTTMGRQGGCEMRDAG